MDTDYILSYNTTNVYNHYSDLTDSYYTLYYNTTKNVYKYYSNLTDS